MTHDRFALLGESGRSAVRLVNLGRSKVIIDTNVVSESWRRVLARTRGTAAVLAALVVALALALTARADAYVYWTVTSGLDTENIARANLDGSDVDTEFLVASCCESPFGIALDDTYLYWANRDGQDLSRANLDGSGQTRLVDFASSFPGVLPHGVAVDANHIYWASGDAIGRANIDGSNPDPDFIAERCTYLINDEYVTQACDPELGQEVAYFPAPQPRRIAVDAGHIYWTQGTNAIGRADLDGANRDLSFITGANNPQGVAVDSNHIYWANTGADAIGRADINGSNVDQSFVTGAGGRGIAVDAGYIYWAGGSGPGGVGRAALDGSNVDNSFITTPYNAVDIAVDALGPDIEPPETTIASGPPATTSDSTPTFSFASSEPGASFECRFDSDPFAACSGPGDSHTPGNPIAGGPHTFEVRATDQAGNTDTDPASRSFTVDATTMGDITTVVGTGAEGDSGDGGPAAAATLAFPTGVGFDDAGNLYISDDSNTRVRKVDGSGTITRIAGTSTTGFSGDGGPATSAELGGGPSQVAVDNAGNVYIPDMINHRVRKVDTSGTITTIAGSGGVGDGNGGFSGDGGPATSAQLNYPSDVAFDSSGNLYIADSGNHRVRKVDGSGTITTVAGFGTSGGDEGDGGPATLAHLNNPRGIAFDSSDNLYIADLGNNRIRKVDGSGTISTVAGTGTEGFSGDGGPATSAELDRPYRVALDAAGNLYIAEPSNHRIRKVDSSGTITTVAGSGGAGDADGAFSGDGGPATSARLHRPFGVAVAGSDIYIADSNNNRIRRIEPDTVPPLTTITSGPSGATNDPTPTYGFSSSEPGSSFECRFDSAPFAACSGSATHTAASPLADGDHTFEVRAVDQSENADPSPSMRSFTVDTVPPTTSITAGPTGPINDPSPTFSFSSTGGTSFQCRVDTGTYSACTSPKTIGPLVDGAHTFYVRAKDAAGNLDPSPETRSVTIDTAEVKISGSTLIVTAATGAKDNLVITKPTASTLRVTDLASGVYTGSGVHTGAGCTRSGDSTADCNASGITLIQVSSGDQIDKLANSTALKGSLNGGAANDLVTGGSGVDTLTGSTGADTFKGMGGNDQLLARDLVSDTSIDCGAGTADKADLDLLPKDPDSAVIGCETKTRH